MDFSGFNRTWHEYDGPGATQYAFAALVDLYRGISVYDKYVLENKRNKLKAYDEIIRETVEGLEDYFTSMKERLIHLGKHILLITLPGSPSPELHQ